MSSKYDQLLEKFKEIQLLGTLSNVLYWDMNTYMPPSGLEFRTKQFQYLSQRIHKLWTSTEMVNLISISEKNNELDELQRRNVVLLRRQYDNRTVIPGRLVGSIAAQSNKTLEIWKKAKAENDFQMVLPDLENLFSLNIEAAELLAKSKNINDPYEALIDQRDKGFSVTKLKQLFDEVKSFLVPFVKKCKESSMQINRSFLSRNIPRAVQVDLVQDLASYFEYDYSKDKGVGRIDEVEHPLTIGCGPSDVRVTVKYHENNVLSAFLAGAHECGHAIDGLQANPEWIGQPIYRLDSPSLGESQSRFFENLIASSIEFWEYYYPRFQKLTQGIFDDISVNSFYFGINAVNPGLIRIQADEVTYILHIIIRFEIEKDLFDGKIEIKDLPEVWNEKYKEYLGVDVPTDTLGVMQDLHWFSQYWGYFHGYAIGDIMSSQITMALTRDIPEWHTNLQNGFFSPIREWLRDNIHSKGGLYDSLELIERVTGKPLTTEYFIDYIKQKFSRIYQL